MIAGDGRPLRFLALVGGSWVAVRVALLWHATGSLPAAIRGVLPLPERAIAAAGPPLASPPSPIGVRADLAVVPRAPAGTGAIASVPRAADPARVQLALLAMTRFGQPLPYGAQASAATGGQLGASALPTQVPPPSRLSVSGWLIARGGVGQGASSQSPQLGGTQGGVRVDYGLGRGLAATARIAAPAAGAGRELSLGIAWRPSGVPLRFVAEQRLALDGGHSGPALGVSGGVSELRLAAGFRLEGYGQAGAILRDGVERYVDGSVRAARPIADIAGVALDVGGGAWGGAQRGVARLDLGPSIGARVPVAGKALRVSVDWRQRIAGNARPGSGPALTLGSDF